MKTKYLSPLVCKEIAKMLLEGKVKGDILLKSGDVEENEFEDVKDGSTQPYRIKKHQLLVETFATFMAYQRNKNEQLLVSLIKKTLPSLNVE